MGFMDNMLHPESLKTVTSVNSGHFEGKLGRLSMENGDCFFHTGPPKYKRRSVSAVRDFPPGCGPFVRKVQLLEPKNVLISEGDKVVVSSDQGNNRLESVSAEHVESKSPASQDLNNAGLSEPGKHLEDAAMALSKDLHMVVASASKEQMISLSILKSLSPSDSSSAVFDGNGLGGTMDKSYPPRRNFYAIRDFPPMCGRNAPCLIKESLKVFSSPKNNILGQEKSDLDERTLKKTIETDVRLMGEDLQDKNVQESKLRGNVDRQSDTVAIKESKDIGEPEEKMGKEMVLYQEDLSIKRKRSKISGNQNWLLEEDKDNENLEPMPDWVVVQGLMAAPNCPWRKGKGAYKPHQSGATSERKEKKHSFFQSGKYKSAARTKYEVKDSGVKSKKKNSFVTGNTANQSFGQMVIAYKEDSADDDDEHDDYHLAPRPHSFEVNVPPIECSVSSNGQNNDGVTRNKVREALRLFQAICRKLLQEVEAKSKVKGKSKENKEYGKSKENNEKRKGHRRIDYEAAAILKDNKKYVNTGKQILGPVRGVEIGDEFHYRVELNIIGLHRPIQGGIDYVKHDGKILATSVVASGGYADLLDSSDSLIYTGQGGNVMKVDKEPEDQKLERGNLALKNSMHEKNSVRVIRGSESSDGRTYVYDGLYLVRKCWQELGPHGKLVFKFQLDRIPGQPELAWQEVRKSKKYKIREGLCVDDISQGKELIPISAVNTIDDEKPPPFAYITSMIYPDWCHPQQPKGCNCTNGCSDSESCLCAVRNGGEIPFNHNGAIVEAKPLVYECGPSCLCPPSCHNRVSQHGIKFQLEIFKTKSRGWGVRSLNSIPSGSFICEYIGELLEEKEAEQRTGNDEYLFDIGNLYNDSSLWDGLSSLMPDVQASSSEVVEDGGFTIDAAQYGNVGRFINHSCSPNLYAQNVLYDRDDRRIPHIMLFAAENIPPLQELTYHYNYVIDQVRDSNGNIKKKSCYCGSIECTGRMY